jgi:hypothetical protein
MRAFRRRQTGIVHAAAEYYVDGRDNPPALYPMCSVPAVAFYGMELLSSVPLAEITCDTCRRMDEFKDLLRKGARVGLAARKVAWDIRCCLDFD